MALAASAVSFLEESLESTGKKLSISRSWISFDDTKYPPLSPNRLKPNFKLYLCATITPSICSASSVSVTGDPIMYSKFKIMVPSSYRLPLRFGLYLNVLCLFFLG